MYAGYKKRRLQIVIQQLDFFFRLVFYNCPKELRTGKTNQAPSVNGVVPHNFLLAKLRQHHSLCSFEQKLLGSAIWWNSTKVGFFLLIRLILRYYILVTILTVVIQDVILLWYSLFCKMFSFHMNTSEQERRPQTACQKNTDAQRQMLQLCKAHLALGSILGHPAPCWSVSYIPLQGHSQPDSSKTSSWYTRTCQAKLYKARFKFISKVSHSSCCTSQIHRCQQHRFRNIYLSLWLAYISAFSTLYFFLLSLS